MGDPVRCLPKVVHPDVAALKLQHNPRSHHDRARMRPRFQIPEDIEDYRDQHWRREEARQVETVLDAEREFPIV